MATLTSSQRGAWNVLRLVGEIQTFADAATLRAVLFDRLSRENASLALDLSDLSYIGSSGIGVVAQVQQELEKRNKSLVLIGANSNVKHLLEIVSLDRLVQFLDQPDQLDELT
ncbi:MAG TPA: STAS domain-containing protein [Fibrobacteria bacterium]|nr:STAS domain-containing protein [Fibrobacteria bacterium]